MRSLLTSERAVSQAARVNHYLRVETQNPDGAWTDLGSVLGADYTLGATWGESKDQRLSGATVRLRRANGSNSMVPLMTASLVNRNNAATYAPLLDLGRGLRISTATTRPTTYVPSVIVARKSSNNAGAPPATARLTALGFAVTESLAATVAACRAYDVVVIDSSAWALDEHAVFIRQLVQDGQRVLCAGNDTRTIWWATANHATSADTPAQVGGAVQASYKHAVWTSVTLLTVDTDAGYHITGVDATMAAPYGAFTNDASAYSVVEFWDSGTAYARLGGLGLFIPQFGLTGNSEDQFLVNAVRYMAGLAVGGTVSWAQYREVWLGRIGNVDWYDDPIVVTGSDQAAWLMDCQFEPLNKVYGSTGGTAVETVMQSILDDGFGAGLVTLYTPTSPGWMLRPYTQDRVKVFEAIQDLGDQIGWDMRYRYDAAHYSKLTFRDPLRNRSTVDTTIGPGEYFDVRRLELDLKDVRNAGKMPYIDPTGTQQFVTASDAGSIAKVKRRYFELALNMNLRTTADAQTAINNAVADMANPFIEQEISCYYLWFVQLDDRYTFTQNGVHYDQDQTLAVAGYEHTLENGEGTTVIQCSGKVVGSYAAWQRQINISSNGTGTDTILLPQVTAVALSMLGDGFSFIIDATGNDAVGSWRFAVSNTAYPTRATVEANAVQVGQHVVVQSAYPTATVPGMTLYVSALAYSGSAGTGTDSGLQQYQRAVTAPPGPSAIIEQDTTASTDTDFRVSLILTGAPGVSVVYMPGHLDWRYRKSNGANQVAWGAWQTATDLPQTIVVTRFPKANITVELQVQQPDGQIAADSFIVYASTPGIDRTSGGVDRTTPYNDGFYAPRATDTSGVTVDTTVKDSRGAAINNMFRYGTDGAAGVVESGTQAFIHGSYIDSSRRPVAVRDGATDVGAAVINTGQAKANGGLSNNTGGLVATAADTRSAAINTMFRYGTDGAAGIVESATQTFVHGSYVDSSRRPITVYAQDNRSLNTVPNDYPIGTTVELKFRSTVSAPGSATFGTLVTEKQWNDNSGGSATQTFKSADGTFKREGPCGGTATTDWGDWRYVFEANTMRVDRISGHLTSDCQQYDGVTLRNVAKGHWAGQAKHGDSVVFAQVFATTPSVIFRPSGKTWEPRSKWGTRAQVDGGTASGAYVATAAMSMLVSADSLSTSGFTLSAYLYQVGSTTTRGDDFAANTLNALNATVALTVANAPSFDNNYTAHYSVTLSVKTALNNNVAIATIVVTLETNDGVTGWQSRSSQTYSKQGPSTYDGVTYTQNWTNESLNANVAGLDNTDQVRLRLSTYSTTPGGSGGSASGSVHGFGSSDSTRGVTYATATGDQCASMTPDTTDYIYFDVFETSV